MKQKNLTIIFCLFFAVLLFSGCDGKQDSAITHTHDYIAHTTEPTCMAGGYTTYACDCGESYTDQTVAALGHQKDEWEIVTQATKTENGLKVQKCSRCGEKMGEEIIFATGSVGLKFGSNGDGTCYVSSLGTCTDMDVVVPSEHNGERVTAIHSAFKNCPHLTSVVLPDSVTDIGMQAFGTCLKLKSITLGNNVRRIGDAAFVHCQSLEDIVIPESVAKIGNGIFAFCPNLKTIHYNGTIAQWNAISKGSLWNQNLYITEIICADGIVSLQ